MTTLLVDIYEGPDVATFDVTGVYLNAVVFDNKYGRIKLDGQFMDIMWAMNPHHITNKWYKNVKKVLKIKFCRQSMQPMCCK